MILDLGKKIVIIMSFSVTLSTVSVFFGLLKKNYDDTREDVEDLQKRMQMQESQARTKLEIDKLQTKAIDDVSEDVEKLRERIYSQTSFHM